MLTQFEFRNKLSWFKKDILEDHSYLRELSKKEESLILESLGSLKDTDISYKKKYTPIPKLKGLQILYDDIMHSLLQENGFIIVKGFPTFSSKINLNQIKKLLLEFCLYLGTPLRQNKKHDILFDVRSIEGIKLQTKDSRGPYVKDALPMHTDAGAILGMYCLSTSEIGGDTLLSSSRTVHDEIKKIRPDLLSVLYKPLYVDRRGNEPEGELPYDLNPVFAMYENQLVCQYHQPFYLDAQKKFPDIPRLTIEQLEAIKLFDAISLREDIVFKIKLEEGDIIFINNEKILHGRSSFDYVENEKIRHLLRIWLNTEKIQYTFPNFLGYPS